MACIRTGLISGASAVSLVPRPEDWTRLLSSSLTSRTFSGPAQLSVGFLCQSRAQTTFRQVRKIYFGNETISVPQWLGGGCEQSYSSLVRLPRSCTSSTPCFLFFPGLSYSACVLFALLWCTVTFDFTFLFNGSSIVCGVLRRSLREHNCAISTTPEASL